MKTLKQFIRDNQVPSNICKNDNVILCEDIPKIVKEWLMQKRQELPCAKENLDVTNSCPECHYQFIILNELLEELKP